MMTNIGVVAILALMACGVLVAQYADRMAAGLERLADWLDHVRTEVK